MPDDIPSVTVMVAPDQTAPGHIFMAPYERRLGTSPYASYLLILDEQGELVYHKRLSGPAEDFKKQVNGLLSYTDNPLKGHYVMNPAYKIIDEVQADGEYRADFHDFQILPNGHKLVLIFERRTVDMSQLVEGGNPEAIVAGCRIQELDAQDQAVFEWTSFDHIPITDTGENLLGKRIDYVHCNSIGVDNDGHLLLSGRSLSEITKINRQTGQVIWRLGGQGNQFIFVNAIGAEDVEFVRQHDARRAPNGNLTLFDNRLGVANYSRAVEYDLDETNKIATLVWEFRDDPDNHGHIMGNAQRLPNGNTLIGWGSGDPAITEVTREGTKVFELRLPAELQNYRAFRFPWRGQPSLKPDLIVETETPTITLTYSWNGATDVAAYAVYGDKSAYPKTLITVEPKTSFETTTVITTMRDGPYQFRVMPLDAEGRPLQIRVFLPLLVR